MNNILDTGIKISRNVLRYVYGKRSLTMLPPLLKQQKTEPDSYTVFHR